MSSYCSISDVYAWIPRGSVQSTRRLLASVSASTEVLELDGHGLDDDDAVSFAAEAGGSLPSPLAAGTTYYAIRLTDATFSVAATVGGDPINLTTAGENVSLICGAPWTTWIEAASNEIENTLPAYVIPLTDPVPDVVRAYCAGKVALAAIQWGGLPQQLATGIVERMKLVGAELGAWRRHGLPVRGGAKQVSGNLAITSSSTAADPRGWASRGNGVLP